MRRHVAFVLMLALGWALVGSLSPRQTSAAPIESAHRSLYTAQTLTEGCAETAVFITATDRQGRAFPVATTTGMTLEITLDRMDTCTGQTLWTGAGRAALTARDLRMTMEHATLTAVVDVTRTDLRGEVAPFVVDLIWEGSGDVVASLSTATYYPNIRCVTELAQRTAAVSGTLRGVVGDAAWVFGPEGWGATSMDQQRQYCAEGASLAAPRAARHGVIATLITPSRWWPNMS
jgi:hypothetical protein